MKVIAHRGYSAKYPENTLIAIKKALGLGAEMIEIDIHESKDNKIIVIHDETLNRTCNKKGRIDGLTSKEIKQASAGVKFSKIFSEEKVPFLEEVLTLISNASYRCELNIEIKFDKSGKMLSNLLEMIDEYNLRDRILVSSFNHKLLKKFKILAPDIRIGVLASSNLVSPLKYLKDNKIDAYSFNGKDVFIEKSDVEELHKNGIKTLIYTVNCPNRAKELDKMGVDGVFTDEYEKIKREFID